MHSVYLLSLEHDKEIFDLKQLAGAGKLPISIYTDNCRAKTAEADEESAAQIISCDLFLFLADRNSLMKTDCYRDQLAYAQYLKKPVHILLFTEEDPISEETGFERELAGCSGENPGANHFVSAGEWMGEVNRILKSVLTLETGAENETSPAADHNASPDTGAENRTVLYCPVCGHKSDGGHFCPYCGATFSDYEDSDALMGNPSCVGPAMADFSASGGSGNRTSVSSQSRTSSSGEKEIECPSCRSLNPAGSVYCHSCGHTIPSTAGQSGPSASFPNYSQAQPSASFPSYGQSQSSPFGSNYGYAQPSTSAPGYGQAQPSASAPDFEYTSASSKAKGSGIGGLRAAGKILIMLFSAAALIGLGYLFIRYLFPPLAGWVGNHSVLTLEIVLFILLIAGYLLLNKRMSDLQNQLLEVSLSTRTNHEAAISIKGLSSSVSGIEGKINQNTSDIRKILEQLTHDKADMLGQIQDLRTTVKNSSMNNDPYVFISYCHRTRFAPIRSLLDQMDHQGYAVWYDSNLSGGCSFNDEIAEHIKYSSCFMPLIDQEYVASDYCKDELFYARTNHCTIIPVFLEETKLTPGIEMRLSQQTHQIYRFKYPEDGAFYHELFLCKGLQDMKKK